MSKFVSNQDYKSIRAVRNAYVCAFKILAVEGGWMVFDSMNDFQTWRNQR